jgi:hypothetical protein
MIQPFKDYLSRRNAHDRDCIVTFHDESHTYQVIGDDSKYTSTTTLVHSCFQPFNSDEIIYKMMKGRNWNSSNKYWGKTPNEIKELWSTNGKQASMAGTLLHKRIEDFLNVSCLLGDYSHQDILNLQEKEQEKEQEEKQEEEVKEWNYFIQFVTQFPDLKPYRTEWVVYHENYKISGCIDMVYQNEDGTVSIYDWKRVREISIHNSFHKTSIIPIFQHIPDTNFWHYSLQLNIYKRILEDKYDKVVKEMFLVQLHPDLKTYEVIPVPVLKNDICKLFNYHLYVSTDI